MRFQVKKICPIILIFLLQNFLAAEASIDEMYKRSKLFTKALSYIETNYSGDEATNLENVIDGAITGMVSKLDEFCVYLDPKKFNEFKEDLNGGFGGIGIRYEKNEPEIKIIEVYKDSPAEKAGIKINDVLVSVDDKIFKEDQNIFEISELLKGKIGTKVQVGIKRLDDKTKIFEILKIEIKRERIQGHSVIGKILPNEIGYIRIYEFAFSTKDEFNAVSKNLLAKGAKYFILDLRSNPGGLFQGAIDIAKKFIGDKKIIVSTIGKNISEIYYADEKADLKNFPLVVLINKNSASSAEILTAAIKDNLRGIVIGKKSFGKGSVQTLLELDDKRAIKITTAKYYTPSGECIHRKGIEPDVTVKNFDDNDTVFDYAIQLAKMNKIIESRQ